MSGRNQHITHFWQSHLRWMANVCSKFIYKHLPLPMLIVFPGKFCQFIFLKQAHRSIYHEALTLVYQNWERVTRFKQTIISAGTWPIILLSFIDEGPQPTYTDLLVSFFTVSRNGPGLLQPGWMVSDQPALHLCRRHPVGVQPEGLLHPQAELQNVISFTQSKSFNR